MQHVMHYIPRSMYTEYMCVLGATEDAINAARDALHAHLAATQRSQHVQETSEDDLSLLDDKETDIEFAGRQIC